MNKQLLQTLCLSAFFAMLFAGCASWKPDEKIRFQSPSDEIQRVSHQEFEDPVPGVQIQSAIPSGSQETQVSGPWPLTLKEAIHIALTTSPVFRDLGGRLVQVPTQTPTIYDPSIRLTDPRFGVEAALSEYDTQLLGRAFFDSNNRVLNNELLGGGVNFFQQDLWRMQSELAKKTAAGTKFSLRHNLENDANNADRNLFPNVWDWNVEAEVRQPLLQGNGVAFNRIAGRSEVPGVATGVVIAKVNGTIGTHEFHAAVRDFISNIENAYWELYFAARDLDVKRRARDNTAATIEAINKRPDAKGSADKLYQAREQYFRFQEDVENSLNGKLLDSTRNFNGSGGGTFQGTGGVLLAERRLRLMMGLPMQDNRIILPTTEPPRAPLAFDEAALLTSAIQNRSELIIQRLRIQRRDLTLVADRNRLLPRLDMVGRYRRRALGDDLYNAQVPNGAGGLVGSERNEWQLGLEFSAPIGFRREHAAIKFDQLQIARERAILTAMERDVSFSVSNALRDVGRAFRVIEAAEFRLEAARQRREALRQEVRAPDFNLWLDAEARLAEAASSLHRARVSYAVSIKNLHFASSSLMSYSDVQLADAAAP